MQHNGLTPRQRPGDRQRRDRRRGQRRHRRSCRELGYHVVALHRQGRGDATTCESLGAAEIIDCVDASTSPRCGRSTKATLGRRRRQPRRQHMLAWMLPTMKQAGSVASVGLAAGIEFEHDRDAVHPARRARCSGINSVASARCRCGKSCGTGSPTMAADASRRPRSSTIDFADLPTHFDALSQRHGARPHGGATSAPTPQGRDDDADRRRTARLTRQRIAARSPIRDAFWREQAALIDWQKPFAQVLDYSKPPFARWFVGGETNLCHNAVDRHLADARRAAGAGAGSRPRSTQRDLHLSRARTTR